MPAKKLSPELRRQALAAFDKANGNVSAAARTLGISRETLKDRLAVARGPVEVAAPPPSAEDVRRQIAEAIRKQPLTLAEIAAWAKVGERVAWSHLEDLKAGGLNVHALGNRFSIEKTQAPAFSSSQKLVYESRKDNTYVFGVTSDNHLGSKYERLDALETNYDRFAKAKVDRVFNSGNWIEGEARFNLTEIHTHGMEAQLDYLAEHYPARKGIVTYAVAGDDHEGWYAQRGVNIGKRAEQTMQAAGRVDWVDLGFMEAHVTLRNANTGKEATLAVVHPGGGSAYAESYVVQKIIESYDGGEKPSVALYGHYHKCLAGNSRNVWWVLVPSTKDQDTFMRKKRLRSVVGGGIITLKQDPDAGAIYSMTPELWTFFNKGFYNGRWSHTGDVVLPERSIR